MTTESSDLRRRVTRLERSSAIIQRIVARVMGFVVPRRRSRESRSLTPVEKHDFHGEMRGHGIRKDSDYTPDPEPGAHAGRGGGGGNVMCLLQRRDD